MSAGRRHLSTLAVHAGSAARRLEGAIVDPLFRSATYELGDPENYESIRYVRLGTTPTQKAVEAKLAALEGTEDAIVTASGTAAATFALLSQLSSGDHLLAQKDLYGGTRKSLEQLARHAGIEVDFFDSEAPSSWSSLLRPNTRVLYAEALTNPLLSIPPLDELVAFARQHRLLSMIDSTLVSPALLRPFALGFDVVIHSATKYLNGHGDVVAGVVAGSRERLFATRQHLGVAGVYLDPQACFLLQRGLRTLPLRMESASATAKTLARWLRQQAGVERVHYPALEGDPAFARAQRWFSPGSQSCYEGFHDSSQAPEWAAKSPMGGALLSLRLSGGEGRAQRFVAALQLAVEAPSFGGLESLVCRPASTIYRNSEPGSIPQTDPAIIRLAIGLEHVEDLREDIEQALRASEHGDATTG